MMLSITLTSIHLFLKEERISKKNGCTSHNILASIKLALIYPPLSAEDIINLTREWSSIQKPNCLNTKYSRHDSS